MPEGDAWRAAWKHDNAGSTIRRTCSLSREVQLAPARDECEDAIFCAHDSQTLLRIRQRVKLYAQKWVEGGTHTDRIARGGMQ